MRVAHLIDSLNLGGTETQCAALVRGLAARGIENLVVFNHPGPLRDRFEVPGVSLAHVPCDGFVRAGFPLYVRRLAREFAAWGADVVQTYGTYTNLPGLLAGRFARVPVLAAGKRGFDPHLSPALRRIDRVARRLAHATVANSEALGEWLVREERTRGVTVITNCVLERAPVTPAQDPVVGMVANFQPWKDHETFLRAAALVAEQVPTAQFHLVGDGPNAEAARALTADLGLGSRVCFVGRLGRDEVWTALGRFAVSVQSSFSEGMPNAVLEAMLAARPVVATDIPGMREVVEHGITGYLVPPRDPAGLAAAITRLLEDPELAIRIGAAGRRHVLTAHGQDRMVDDFLRLWRALGAGRREALSSRQEVRG
jgi:glycosyltransferase involved in cell wall biosynthesis